MASAASITAMELVRRVRRLQVLTVAWMTVEAAVALAAAWVARSPALLGFGGDSAIELLSAAVVLWRFRYKSAVESERAEKIAARIAGALLLLLAVFIAIASTLAFLGYEPRPSLVGIILLLTAAVGMPWLASQKRKLAGQLSSAALKADAAESAFCGYLSWIALAGLVANAVFHKSWADPVAALLLIPLVAREGWEALRSSRRECGD